MDLTGEQFLKQAQAPPGQMTHLRLSPLSKETQYIDDPLVGQIPFRPRELSPEYGFRWLDTGAKGEMAWLQPPMPDELAQRALARTIIEAQRDALVTKSQRTLTRIKEAVQRGKGLSEAERKAYYANFFSHLKEAELKQLLAQLVQLELLSDRGTGFLETVPNLFESGASGIVWNFAVPNIEKVFLSSWQLQADQKQCFRIQRLSPLPDQVRPTFEIIFGNGRVQYALVFTKDEAVELRHYRDKTADNTPITPAQRATLEAQWKTVLATGYLTAEDLAYIAVRKAEIDLLKKRAKDAGSEKLSPADSVRVGQLKDEIEARRKSKNGLTDAKETERIALEKQLFYKRKAVTLQEDTRSLFDREFNVTLGFHRKGFISVRLGMGADPGKEAFYYELENLTKTNQPGLILPSGSHIMLRTNGGPFGLTYGVADHAEKATLYSQPFQIPFLFEEEDWRITVDGIGLSEEDADPLQPLLRLPRCRVETRVEEVEAGEVWEGSEGPDGNPVIRKFPKVRACLDFISESHPSSSSSFKPLAGNHDYGAEVYRATCVCVPGEPPDPSGVVWDSRQHGFPIEDVQFQSTLDGGPLHHVFVRDRQDKPAGLPVALENRWCELGVLDTRPSSATYGDYIVMARGATAKEPGRDDIRRFLNEDGKLATSSRYTSGSHLLVSGLESRFDRPIEVPLIGNNQRPNEYLRDLFLMHGLAAVSLQGIPQGQLTGLERLPPPRPGEYPNIRPNRGDSLWSYAQEIVRKHCQGWRLRVDALLGATFERAIYRDRTSGPNEVHFKTKLPHAHHRAVLREIEGSSDSLRLWQDTKDYWPEAEFIGAWNPGAGRRYASTYRVWEATHRPDSLYYLGERKVWRAQPDDSLNSQTRCDRAGRQFQMRYGLPPWYAAWLAWFDPSLREGDLIRVDGIKVVVWALTYLRFSRGLEQKVQVTARLAADVRLPVGG